MPESMTGFSTAQVVAEGVEVHVEMRSVNHRHLDLRLKLPAELTALQGELTKMVRKQLDRGHIDARVVVRRDEENSPQVQVDLPLAQAWHTALTELTDALNLAQGPALDLIVSQPGVLQIARPEEDVARMKPVVIAAMAQAISGLVKSRQDEGAALAVDLCARLENLQTLRGELAELSVAVVAEQHQRLRDRVTRVLEQTGHTLDQNRLAQEVVLLSDKSDVTEELVRLAGHLAAAESTLQTATPGKRLGFLAQEILREFNTVGSKSGALAITECVVSAKVEIEKVREQVLNLA